MTRDQAREEMKSRLTEYVQSITKPSCGENMYVCPLCGSGEGKHKTGAFSVYDNGQKWKCFSCGNGGDLFELIGQIEHIGDFKNRMDRAAEIFHITLDSNDEYKKGHMIMERTEIKSVENETTAKEEPEVDYTENFNIANRQLFDERYKEGLEYLHKRGISDETARKFNVGYVPFWRHPKVTSDNVPTSPRIIIPTSKSTYMARDIRSDSELDISAKRFTKQKVGKVHILNESALWNSETPIYVVEGEIDLMSIIEVGGNGIALGSTNMVDKFLSLVSKKPPIQPLIVSLDNDEDKNKGEKAALELMKGLEEQGIPCIKYNPCGKHKDPNEALTADRSTFTAAVEHGSTLDIPRKIVNEDVPTDKENYMRLSNGGYFQGFVNRIANSVNDTCISTGFKYLDNCLGDGLQPGLYLIGAVPSLGKTTFTLQIADNAAYCGHDVMFFSLEMSRDELMSKSVSRHTATYLVENGKNVTGAKSTTEIMRGKCHQHFTEAESVMVEEAMKRYAQYADRIFVEEGCGDLSVYNVCKAVERHIKLMGKTPLIVIDYLQILAPYPGYERSAERVIADKTTMELKRLGRDLKTPILVISSFNRQSYNQEVSFSSFKESGGLEYGADVLLGLQFDSVNKEKFSDVKAKSGDIYNIELMILKQRNGKVGNKVKFDFFPRCNYFMEAKGQGQRK
ncbi:MAG: DNA primase [Ruminococcaceae bacterium]|nr:DNA primase [Oscillospiraceae bacterium]